MAPPTTTRRGGVGIGSRGARRGRAPSSHRAPPLPSSTPSLPDRRHRDSDASICSSRPSSTTSARPLPPASCSSMLEFVNSYLSTLDDHFCLKPPIPSARDISSALHLISSHLGFPIRHPEDELPTLLHFLSYPFKLPPKSALRAPATPHAWPHFLSALHFLAELASVLDHLDSSGTSPLSQGGPNSLLSYSVRSYAHYIEADDEAVASLDDEYLHMARLQVDAAAAAVEALEKDTAEKEARARQLREAPTPREAMEKERDALVGDVAKFRAVVEAFSGKAKELEGAVEARRKELEAKEQEGRRVAEENEELRRKVAAQAVDLEGAERMRKELGVAERGVEEARASRRALEEKSEELDVMIGKKLKEAMELEDLCNGAIRKLKLCDDFQYVLNADGSSVSEVLGTSYKSVLKPACKALAEEMKRSYVEKIDMTIALQQQLQQQAVVEREKKEHISELQAKIDDATACSNLIKKEIEDHSLLCESETKRMITEGEARMQQLEIIEKEAKEFLKSAEMKLQEEKKLGDESIQMCAQELLALIDLISNYKEEMESTISGMKLELCETIKAVADVHKASFDARLSAIEAEASNLNLKRVRLSSEGT